MYRISPSLLASLNPVAESKSREDKDMQVKHEEALPMVYVNPSRSTVDEKSTCNGFRVGKCSKNKVVCTTTTRDEPLEEYVPCMGLNIEEVPCTNEHMDMLNSNDAKVPLERWDTIEDIEEACSSVSEKDPLAEQEGLSDADQEDQTSK